MSRKLPSVAALVAGFGLLSLSGVRQNADPVRADAALISPRKPWTTSRIVGSPEPPPKYRTERAFPKLKFVNPLLITHASGTDRLFVGEQLGKIFSIRKTADGGQADLFIDLQREIKTLALNPAAKEVTAFYGLTFHPQFEKNRYCYICYVLASKKPGEQLADGSRLSRFRVTATDPPRVEPDSEQILLTFRAGGHNGGCLKFGPDGYLYISTGDADDPSPPDRLHTGQDLSDLLSSILRIDVDRNDPGLPYRIPPDNPFLGMKGIRGEIWAYGFRNPWKMSFDRQTGELWVGDVGWELWEMVHRIERGGNYGWSIVEGRQPVNVNDKPGPTPILPPTIELSHTISMSVTGGYVYRGKQLPELFGTYIFGDWETRRIWAARFQDGNLSSMTEITEPILRVVAFGEDRDGELYVVDYDAGTIHAFAKNDVAASQTNFPRKLSETGLFSSVAEHRIADGVVPFSINVEQWADHATAERFVALPGMSTVALHAENQPVAGTIVFGRQLDFPANGVLAKTISLEMEKGNPASRRRMETQILHFNGKSWNGYTYQWNEAQTDADLVPAEGLEKPLTIIDRDAPGGSRRQHWNFFGRAQCILCHHAWAQHSLAFTVQQLNRVVDYAGVKQNQLHALIGMGVVDWMGVDKKKQSFSPSLVAELPRLVSPHDDKQEINQRARSYLHANCAHCHQFQGGGAVLIDLRCTIPIDTMKICGVKPVQGTFDIPDGQIVAPADPYRSVLYFRMAKVGRGRMPHLGSEIVDEAGLQLIHDWIRQLPRRTDDLGLVELLQTLDEPNIIEKEKKQATLEIDQIAAETAKAGGRATPNDADRKLAEAESKKRARERAGLREKMRTEALNRLLSSTSGALVLARSVAERRLPAGLREQVVAAGTRHSSTAIRDLFERFLPEQERIQRLGNNIRPAVLLAVKGDVQRGKDLFEKDSVMQCKNCHRVGQMGGQAGPDLTQVGKRLDKPRILENILEPSKQIDPTFVTYVLETKSGQVHTGVIVKKTGDEIRLRDAKNNEIVVPSTDVETLQPTRQSLMPEFLLRDLTAQQAADLLEYLASLR